MDARFCHKRKNKFSVFICNVIIIHLTVLHEEQTMACSLGNLSCSSWFPELARRFFFARYTNYRGKSARYRRNWKEQARPHKLPTDNTQPPLQSSHGRKRCLHFANRPWTHKPTTNNKQQTTYTTQERKLSSWTTRLFPILFPFPVSL